VLSIHFTEITTWTAEFRKRLTAGNPWPKQHAMPLTSAIGCWITSILQCISRRKMVHLCCHHFGTSARKSCKDTRVLTFDRMKYPSDSNTYAIENQFFYGPSLLINPVTEESSTSVSFYVPQNTWYDFGTQKPISGAGSLITHDNVGTSDIPILVEGGSIIPARIKSAMTTRALRDQDFELLVAPDAKGKASGTLYLDDGENLVQTGTSEIMFTWDGSTVRATGTFGFPTILRFKSVTVYGEVPQKYEINMGLEEAWEYAVGSVKKP
jgi:hypothetical protein